MSAWVHPRGRVFQVGRTWHYEAGLGDKVYLMDNGASWENTLKACNFAVAALSRVLNAGHKLKYTYPEIVERCFEGELRRQRKYKALQYRNKRLEKLTGKKRKKHS